MSKDLLLSETLRNWCSNKHNTNLDYHWKKPTKHWFTYFYQVRLGAHIRKRKKREISFICFAKSCWGCFSEVVKFVISFALAIIHCGLWENILIPLNILSSATNHVGTGGMYCRPYAYVVTNTDVCRYWHFIIRLKGRQTMW